MTAQYTLFSTTTLLLLLLAGAATADAEADTCPDDGSCEALYYRLYNGVLMPKVGLGTAAMRGDETISAVLAAFKAGVRLVDTAESKEWYDQAAVGEAIAQSGIDRKDVFITTKINPRNYGKTSTPAALKAALEELKVDTIDLVLLHFPECWQGVPSCKVKKEIQSIIKYLLYAEEKLFVSLFII